MEENFYKKTILVVDDEKNIRNLLNTNLSKEGYNVIEAEDGVEAVEKAFSDKPDLILLDVMIPKINGVTVCRKIKAVMNVPILMVTAKDSEVDKILGLELGADDYITKPFSIRELIARIKANLRKIEISSTNNFLANINLDEQTNNKIETPEIIPELPDGNLIRVGSLALDVDRFEVYVNGKSVDLTLREFEVLKYLASDLGQAVSREVLLEEVWGYEYYGDIRTVDVTVRRIREKIEKDASNPKILMTKRSIGYYIARD